MFGICSFYYFRNISSGGLEKKKKEPRSCLQGIVELWQWAFWYTFSCLMLTAPLWYRHSYPHFKDWETEVSVSKQQSQDSNSGKNRMKEAGLGGQWNSNETLSVKHFLCNKGLCKYRWWQWQCVLGIGGTTGGQYPADHWKWKIKTWRRVERYWENENEERAQGWILGESNIGGRKTTS